MLLVSITIARVSTAFMESVRRWLDEGMLGVLDLEHKRDWISTEEDEENSYDEKKKKRSLYR